MRTVWQAEIDKFCNRVLAERFEGVPNYGDVSQIDGRRIEPVDVICFGSPCQDLSVAGKRAGLVEGSRSNLFYEAARIIRECKPSIAVWENVPGAFSSHAGRDFGAVVDTLAELGAVDIAWRVIDSRYAGVPQRRRRIYLVADFAGERAAEILFERESCGGHPQTSRETEQDASVAAPLGSNQTGGFRFDLDGGNVGATVPEVAYALAARNAKGIGVREGQDTLVTHPLRAEGADASGDGTGRGTPLTVTTFEARYVRNGRCAPSDLVPPLKAQSGSDGRGVASPLVFQAKDDGASSSDVTPTLRALEYNASHANSGWHLGVASFSENQRGELRESEYAAQLTNGGGKAGQGYPAAPTRAAVRRLTPIECERLQGFPDGWTCLCGAGADLFACKCPDGPRYRALGNAVTTFAAGFVLGRMPAEIERMGSLFSGIGGFELGAILTGN